MPNKNVDAQQGFHPLCCDKLNGDTPQKKVYVTIVVLIRGVMWVNGYCPICYQVCDFLLIDGIKKIWNSPGS